MRRKSAWAVAQENARFREENDAAGRWLAKNDPNSRTSTKKHTSERGALAASRTIRCAAGKVAPYYLRWPIIDRGITAAGVKFTIYQRKG